MTVSHRRRFLTGALAVAAALGSVLAVSPAARADVLTNSADNLRTGWYGNQPKLSPAAVSGSDFDLLGSMAVAGQVYAQPVISRNVLLAATEGNNIYGFNATTREKLWERNLGATFDARSLNNCGDIQPQVGITSTPVVDQATGTAYLISKVGPASATVSYFMHAVDITTGAEKTGWPVQINGSADNDPSVVFSPRNELQRPGLLLMNGVVYAGFSGHCDAKPFQGWVVGVSTANAAITAMFSDETGPNAVAGDGPGGGIWQSGAGLVSDASGDILLSTGNGTPPPTGSGKVNSATLGQSLVRLRVQPNGSLREVDHFAPYDASVLNETDSDVGSGGPVALPPQYFGTAKYPRLTVLVGKQGYIWLNDATDLGGVGQGPTGSDKVINRIGPMNGGVRGRPGVWPGDGGYVYIASSQSGAGTGRLSAFRYTLDGNGDPTLAFAGQSDDLFGFGSGSPVITSDGTTSGSALVWVVRFSETYEPTKAGVGAELRAYDAVPVDGKMVLRRSFPIGQGTKFTSPAVDGGRVYLGTSDGRILVYGSPATAPLSGSTVSFPRTTQGNSSSATATVTAEGAVTVRSISVNNAVFTLGSPSLALPATLTAGQTLSVPITFTPTKGGQVGAALSFDTDQGPAAVSVSGQGQQLAPKLRQFPCCLSFGGVVAGGPSKSNTVTFSNDGAQDLVIDGYELPSAPFTIAGLPPAGTHLVSGQSVTATFTFAPQDNGLYTDEFVIHTNDPSATFDDGPDGGITAGGVSLAGTGGTQGVMRILPKDIQFGDVPVGTSAAQRFTITNTGGTDLNITISKFPTGENGFAARTSLIEGAVIAAGQTVTEQVDFTPLATGPASAVWAITSDDGSGRQDVTFTGNGIAAAPPTLAIGDLDVDRPATGTTAQIPVTLSAPSASTVTVQYASKDGTAVAPGDYTATSGTLTFAPGETSKSIPVSIAGAIPTPAAETFTVSLAKPTGATLSDAQGKLYLNASYLPVSVAVGDTTAAAAAGGTDLTFPVTVTPAPYPGQPVSVTVATADGTAIAANGDYTPVPATTLTFTDTTPTQSVTVHVLRNPAAGSTATVSLALSAQSSGSNIGDASGLGTVYTSAQPLPNLSVSDTSLVRPAAGTADATFTIRLSRPSTTLVPVSYNAGAGTGFTAADFVVTQGNLTFQPGETVKTVSVPIKGSTTSTGTGNVNLNLSRQSGASLADAGGKAYVVSPSRHSFVSVRPATAWKGPSDDTSVNVPVTLDRPAPTAVTVPVSTADLTAVAGTDYLPASTSLTFAPGDTTAYLPVTIKGRPEVTAPKTFTVKIGALSGNVQASSSTATVTIYSHSAGATVPTQRSAPLFTSVSVPDTAQVGQTYAGSVSASGIPEPGYAVIGGRLPAGIRLDARTGQISGTPTAAGTSTFVLSAANTVGDPASTQQLSITVVAANAAPAFTDSAPPVSTQVGQAYTYTFTASGNPAPTFAVSTGALPPGLGLDPVTGVLSGAASTTGAFTFTVSATNGVGNPALTSPITVTVAAADTAPAFTASAPPASGTVGDPYAYTFAASGSPAPAFAVGSGQVPTGLTLTAQGLLSGTPTAAGSFTFTVRAANSAGSVVTDPITVAISPRAVAPVFTQSSPSPTATVGTAYSYAFAASGNPAPTYLVGSGTLPPGLAVNATTGSLSGSPTADGVFTFTVTATNSTGSDQTGPLTITVGKADAIPAFTASAPAPTATAGAQYSYTFLASGNPAPAFGVASGTLPTGLTLNAASGELAGSPTSAGTFTFTVSATNRAGTATTGQLTITVGAAATPPSFTAADPPSPAAVGTSYGYQFSAAGSPTPAYSLGSGVLPSGLSLSAGGLLAGTPTAAGTFSFTVIAANSAGSAVTSTLTITVVKPSRPLFTAKTPPATATTGTPYSYQFVTTGAPSATYAVATGAIPTGLTLDPVSGVLGGTPTSAATFSFTVSASNSAGTTATSKITVKVANPPAAPVITSGAPPANGTVGVAYSFTFTATGSPAPTFAVASGALPAGLKLSSSGVLAGAPTKVATYTFAVRASNASGTATTAVFTISTAR